MNVSPPLWKPDSTAVPELWVRTDSTHAEGCYLGQSVYRVTRCAQRSRPGLHTTRKWSVRKAGKGGHEVREAEGKTEDRYNYIDYFTYLIIMNKSECFDS